MSDAPLEGSRPKALAEASPGLLSRDRASLDKVVNKLRGGRRGFSVIVCPKEIWGEATRYLAEESGREVAVPVVVRTGEEMVEILSEAQKREHSEVVSFAIEDGNGPVLTALNWHREKTRRGAHCLAWLPTKDGLSAFAHLAPDAYSYRDYTLDLRGEQPVIEGWAGEEPVEIRTARLLFELPREPEVRAEAAGELASALFRRGRYEEGRKVALEGLELLRGPAFSELKHVRIRVTLLRGMRVGDWSNGRWIAAYRWCQLGLEECRKVNDRIADQIFFELGAEISSPLGFNHHLVERALRLEKQKNTIEIMKTAAQDAMRRGDFRASTKLWKEALTHLASNPSEGAHLLHDLVRCHRDTGRFRDAARELEKLAQLNLRLGRGNTIADRLRVQLLLAQGEIASAERLCGSLAGSSLNVFRRVLVWYRDPDADVVLTATEAAINESNERETDYYATEHCYWLLSLLASPVTSDLTKSALPKALDLITRTVDRLRTWAADNPPWYRVYAPYMRAGVLSLFDSRHDEAIAAASEAIVEARSVWKPALPYCMERLVQCLARAGRWSSMAPAIQTALDAAREAEHLRILASIQAYNLVRQARTNADRASMEATYSALKKTFSEMGAPRVEAETWLTISPFLPATATFPDAVKIADHAHDLFFDMPMPEMASRCMEWIGDIHMERGQPSRAVGSYQMSLTTLKRYELTPRQKIVEEKLARAK